MIKKKFLLVALLTLPTSALLIAEDNDNIATTMKDENNVDIMPQSVPQQQDMSIANEQQEENEILLEQRFICQQENQEEGVVCQMYECINNDCQISTPIKINSEQKATNDIAFSQKEPMFDVTESEVLTQEEPTTDLTESETLIQKEPTIDLTEPEILTEKETMNTDVTATEEENKEVLTPKEQEVFTELSKKDLTSSDKNIMADIDVPYTDNEEIRELEHEIKSAERMCERAESDPREKAICEAASAKVQWRKEKIKALENTNMR